MPDLAKDERRILDGVHKSVAEFKKEHPEFVDALGAMLDAIEGKYGRVEAMTAQALAELEVYRRMIMREVFTRGPIIEQPMMDRNGRVHTAIKDNPVMFHIPKVYELGGHSASEALLTKKSRGESAKNAELEALLRERRVRLAKSDPNRVPLPPPQKFIETTLVDKDTQE